MKPGQILIAAVLIGGFLANLPTAQATDPTTWAAVSLASKTGAGTVTNVHLDHIDGTEKLGLLYRLGNDVGFLRCDSNCGVASSWTVKNADATGATAPGITLRAAWIGGDDWALAYANGGGSGTNFDLWYSQDDGATWSQRLNVDCAGGGGNCAIWDISGPGVAGTIDVLLKTSGATSTLYDKHSTDWGATWTTESLNDNAGAVGGTSTAQINVGLGATNGFGASIIYEEDSITNPDSALVSFAGVDGKLYQVSTADHFFWTVPYTTNLGSTPDPIDLTTDCPTEGTTPTADDNGVGLAGFKDGSYVTVTPRKTGASNNYLCSVAEDESGDSYPSTSPSANVENNGGLSGSTNGGRGIIASNGVQFITATRVGTTNSVLYRPTSTDPWQVVYSGEFNTIDYGLTATDTRAWFAYINNAAGGPLTIAGADMTAPTSGVVFCADPSLEPGEDDSTDFFGYEYVEDWTYSADLVAEDELGADIELDDGWFADLPEGDSAYFGKGFNSGSKALTVNFRIEAGVDTHDSVFRVAFTTGQDGTPSATTKGDGTDGDNFDDHVGLRFVEEGNDWRITFRQNIGGTSYATIGSSFTHGNPNSPTTYAFKVDSRDLSMKLYLGNATDGELIETRSMSSAFQDELWQDQWFVATGTSSLFSAATVLDDNTDEGAAGNDDSTCIFDDAGGAVPTGSPGSTPGSTIPDDEDAGGGGSECSGFLCSPPGGIGGISAAGINLFLGFLFILGVVWMGISKGIGAAGIGALLVIGLFMAYALGLIPLWVILVIFVIALAAVWFLPKGGGDGVSN